MASRTRIKFLLAFGSALVALAGAELLTRTVILARADATDFASYRRRCLGEALPIFELDAAGELIDCKPSLQQGDRIHINSQGFRGAPVSEPKAADGFRVCCVGGSACFGTTSTRDHFTIAAALQRGLRKDAARPLGVEVMNGGLPGATTYLAVNRYEQRLSKFKPDVVVLYNMLNDLFTSRRTKLGVDPRTRPLVKIDGTLSGWLSHSALWLTWQTGRSQEAKRRELEELAKAEEMQAQARGNPNNARVLDVKSAVSTERRYIYDGKRENNLYLVPEHVDQFRAQLRRFHRVVTDSGAVPLYCTYALRFSGQESQEEYSRTPGAPELYFPNGRMALDAFDAMNEVIREVALETSSPLCDIARDLSRNPGIFNDTDHYTNRGCEEVGRLLADFIDKKALHRGAAERK